MSGLTNEQFEALRRWMDARAQLRADIHARRNDRPFVQARLKELEWEDAHARSKLVDPKEN